MNKFLEFLKRIFKLEVRVNNIIRYGIIKEIDLKNNLIIATIGNNLETPKLPYLVNSSGNATIYFVPKIGDQVLILSPNGEITNAIAIPSIYKGLIKGEEDEWRLEFTKGSIIYKEGVLNIKSTSEININCPKANITSNQIILGDDSGGEVVCRMHTCSFTGGPHTVGSSKIKGAI